jgi:hypothetical protein
MAIKIRHGEVADIAKLATLAGKSIAAQREIEYARAMAQQLQRMEHEKEMVKFRAQLDLESEKRAHQWEFEKAEIRSRTDFAREEAKRMRRLDDADNAIRQIDREVEAGRITNEQADTLKFYQEIKKYGVAPPVSLIKPPTPEKPRYVTPSQQMAAYKQLQTEELREPTWLERWLPGGKEPLTEEEQLYRQMFEKTAKGIPLGTTPSIPTGTISQVLPIVRNDADFDALPSGAEFIEPQGNKRRKP